MQSFDSQKRRNLACVGGWKKEEEEMGWRSENKNLIGKNPSGSLCLCE